MSFILKGQALRYYIKDFREGENFESISRKLREIYVNKEYQNRRLILWQSTRLSEMLRENPDKSELQTFTLMVDKLIATQGQLSSEYQSDTILRDQLMRSADLPNIVQSMRERIPASSLDARNRIATFLSNEPRSACAFVSGCIDHDSSNFTIGTE